jgi:hypothetical protein
MTLIRIRFCKPGCLLTEPGGHMGEAEAVGVREPRFSGHQSPWRTRAEQFVRDQSKGLCWTLDQDICHLHGLSLFN